MINAFGAFFSLLLRPGLSGWFEILLLSGFFYFAYTFFRGDRSVQMFFGFSACIFVLMALAHVFSLDIINWILSHSYGYMFTAAVIVFHPEIRRTLAEIGSHGFSSAASSDRRVLNVIKAAVLDLSNAKIGALIALEQSIGTAGFQAKGIRLDAEVSEELLRSIFYPRNALHDGGVIIGDNRIKAAACIFPLAEDNFRLPSDFGTRHRAAAGFAEATDAIVFVVSEETGGITLFHGKHFYRGLDEKRLSDMLATIVARKSDKRRRGLFPFRDEKKEMN